MREKPPIKEIAHGEPHRATFDDIREKYLATVEGLGSQSRPTERIERRVSGRPERDEGYTDSTVEAPDVAEDERRRHRGALENIRQHAEPPEKSQRQDGSLPGGDDSGDSKYDENKKDVEVPSTRVATEFSSVETLDPGAARKVTGIEETQDGYNSFPGGDDSPVGEQLKDEKVVEESPVQVLGELRSAKTVDSGPAKKGSRMPWLRALLLLLYLGAVGTLAVSESNVHRILRDARAKESAQEHEAAFGMYRNVLDAFPFSFGTIEARQSLRRMCQSQEFEMPKPSWLPAVEHLPGFEADMPDVHLLPFAVWPVSAVLLLLVFVTRIFRPGVAFLALLLMAVAIVGSIAQFAWYGCISLPQMAEAAKAFMKATPVLYFTSYLLLVLTALMTLTATAKRPATRVEKPEELWQ